MLHPSQIVTWSNTALSVIGAAFFQIFEKDHVHKSMLACFCFLPSMLLLIFYFPGLHWHEIHKLNLCVFGSVILAVYTDHSVNFRGLFLLHTCNITQWTISHFKVKNKYCHWNTQLCTLGRMIMVLKFKISDSALFSMLNVKCLLYLYPAVSIKLSSWYLCPCVLQSSNIKF